jgi:hypothetical protein
VLFGGRIELSLIVRDGGELGCPTYRAGGALAPHEDLFRELGHEGEAQLVRGGRVSYRANDGGDSFDALLRDLELVVLPALRESESNFIDAILRSFKQTLR